MNTSDQNDPIFFLTKYGPWQNFVSESSEHLLEMQSLRPTLELLSSNRHFSKIPQVIHIHNGENI